mmetsp:Transcript_13932/g.37385  ORF Transcript_13932/g.37385 Transcript_13932/m.37385 type:complete len:220 (+) Transcript_13932:817-1476(+)
MCGSSSISCTSTSHFRISSRSNASNVDCINPPRIPLPRPRRRKLGLPLLPLLSNKNGITCGFTWDTMKKLTLSSCDSWSAGMSFLITPSLQAIPKSRNGLSALHADAPNSPLSEERMWLRSAPLSVSSEALPLVGSTSTVSLSRAAASNGCILGEARPGIFCKSCTGLSRPGMALLARTADQMTTCGAVMWLSNTGAPYLSVLVTVMLMTRPPERSNAS